MFSYKSIYFIIVFLFILASCTKLPNNLLGLENNCDIDENCKLVLTGLGCCDPCRQIDVSTDVVMAVNLEQYEEFWNRWRKQNCGEVYMCPECAPGSWVNYEKFEARCINNFCKKVEVS